jgi:putative aminopeptidase FrvX
MSAVSGYEQAMADTLRGLLPGSALDRAGNVVLVLGRGEPRRLAACPMDEPGYVVGRVREDGWLTLRRVGNPPGPRFDQQLEGQRVTVFGARGAVPGVVAVRSVHLARGRAAGSDAPFTVDDAYVDLGARHAAEVRSLGVEVLAPVTLEKRPHAYGRGLLAAPAAGRRAACAALLRAARGAAPGSGTTVVAFLVEHQFTRRGLLTVGRTLGPFGATRLVDGAAGASTALPDPAWFGRFAFLEVPVRYAGTPVETVSLGEAAMLERRLRAYLSGED